MIVLMTILMGLLPLIQSQCPVRCNCTANSVSCISIQLEGVPSFENLNNTPMIMDLSGNSISIISLNDFSFELSDQVKEIYLNSSKIALIEENSFSELKMLQEIYLRDNLLNSVPENFIAGNPEMLLLDLSNNYFKNMPKIRSEHLEVFVISDSKISNVEEDALQNLPNLRLLIMRQNNLQFLSSNIFDNLHLGFVQLSYNPWDCNCATVELFDYLTGNNLLDFTDPVQCRENGTFIEIYNNKGVTSTFGNICSVVEDLRDSESDEDFSNDQQWELTKVLLDENAAVPEKLKSLPEIQFTEPITTDLWTSDIMLVMFLISIISLVIGSIFGSYVTYLHMIVNIRQTESTRELLKCSDNFA